jgi:hypothetical protein
MWYRASVREEKNKNAHNLKVGVDQIAWKIIGLVLSTVLTWSKCGKFIYHFEVDF